MLEFDMISFFIGIFIVPVTYFLIVFLFYVFDFFYNYKEYREWRRKEISKLEKGIKENGRK